MKSTLMTLTSTPATGLSSYVAAGHSATAPFAAAHGTGLSIAGTSAAAGKAVVVDVRNTDLPGSHPRGAPV